METLERNQVRLILDRLVDQSLYDTEDKQRDLHAKHAAEGTLRSGATVKKTVRNFESESSLFIERAVNDVSDVAQDIEAFNLITASFVKLFDGFQLHLDKSVRMVTVGGKGQMNSVEVAANDLFLAARNKATGLLKIHQFTFSRPSPGSLNAMRSRLSDSALVSSDGLKPTTKNPGGKPLAKHWDQMWAHITVQLWNGDLKPEKQADLKDAMFAWFNESGIEIGDTAITQRARQLWQAMQAAES